MNIIRTVASTLAFAIAAVLAIGLCDTRVASGLTLDESKLPHIDGFKISDVDTSKNVCNDLFGYTNGKWLSANPIPPDRTSWGTIGMLAERSLEVQRQLAVQSAAERDASGIKKIIGDFYATAMDRKAIDALGLDPIRDRLAEIEQLAAPTDIAAYLRRSAAGGDVFVFNITYDTDFKNSLTMIAYALQGGLGLEERGYYFDEDKREQLDAYRVHVAKVLTLAGAASDKAAAQAKQIIDFETRLAKVSRSSEELSSDISIYYNPVTPAAADKLTPNFSWPAFFKAQGVALPKMFSLSVPAFHHELSKMISDVPLPTWRAYLRFHAIDRASPYLSTPFVNQNFAFYGKTLRGQKEMKTDWKRALATIEDKAGEAMGQLYVAATFPERNKREMQTLVGNFRAALKTRLENLDWMSEPTKQKALVKLAAFTPKIGYPDKWRDWSGLETSRTGYYSNVAAANLFNHHWAMAKIGKPTDRTEWQMTPQTVNAYYNPLRNELVFPAAVLQAPAFDPDAVPETNYAAIGMLIGHEMIHGFDNQGSRFGPTGNFESWWTEADNKQFETRTAELVEQYNSYEAMPGIYVNGKLTLGENIADVGGLNLAYDAMKIATADTADTNTDGLTRDQRFFLTFASDWRNQYAPELQKVLLASDSHSPDRFRAIGAPSNMPAFATAFNCKKGDAMVREGDRAISIW